MSEIWKTIPSFPDYEASSEGRIRRSVPDSRNHACRILKPWIGNHGYETVNISNGQRPIKRLVHRLVCETFHGLPPTEGLHVAHGDGTRRNNAAENLRWATRAENMADCIAHGTKAVGSRHGRTTKPERTPRGERHGHAKLTAEIVRSIRALPKEIGSGRRIAEQFSISPATVCLIRSGKIWSHLN